MDKESFKKTVSSEKALSANQIEVYKNRFTSIDASLDPGQSFYFLFDHNRLKYPYISEGVEEIIGLTSEELNGLDDPYLRFFHKDDLPVFGNRIFNDFRKIRSENLDKMDRLTFQIMGRIKKESGEIVSTLLEYQTLEVDEDIKPVLSFGKITELRFPPSVRGIGVSVYEKAKGKIIQLYDEIYPFANPHVTERELEVLKLIAEGNTAKNIGDLLFISENTVKNHRQNLMKNWV